MVEVKLREQDLAFGIIFRLDLVHQRFHNRTERGQMSVEFSQDGVSLLSGFGIRQDF